MLKSNVVLLSALVSCALISGCKDDKQSHVSIEFMHSSWNRSVRPLLQN